MWGTVVKSLLGIGCFKLCCNDKLNKSYARLVFGQVSNVDNVIQQTFNRNWKWENTNYFSHSSLSSFSYSPPSRAVCLFALTWRRTQCWALRTPPLTSSPRQMRRVGPDVRRRILVMFGAGRSYRRCVIYLKLNQKKSCRVLHLEKKIVKVTLLYYSIYTFHKL